MPHSPRTRFVLYLWVTFAFGLLLAWPRDFSESLSAYPNLMAFLREGLPRLGDALMIAPIVIWAIETAAARELLDSFVKDVSPHIIGNLLPIELRDHIKSYLNESFVRTAWFVEYRLAEWPTDSRYVELKTLVEYTIANRGSRAAGYPFKYALEDSWFPSVGLSKIVTVKATADSKALIDLDEQRIQSELKQPTLKSVEFIKSVSDLTVSSSVDIPREPHGTYKFTVESVECHASGFATHFVASAATLETTVRIYYPVADYDVSLSLTLDGPAPVPTQLRDGLEWVVTRPMLPGQAIITRWARKSPAPAVPTSLSQTSITSTPTAAGTGASTAPGAVVLPDGAVGAGG